MEAVVRRSSVKKMFLEISQNSQENTCARDSFLVTLQSSGNFIKKESLGEANFWQISKNTFFYRTFSVAASAEMLVLNRHILIFHRTKNEAFH